MSRRSLLLALTIAALLSGVGLWISQHEPTEDPNRPSSSNGSTSNGGTSTTELFGPDTPAPDEPTTPNGPPEPVGPQLEAIGQVIDHLTGRGVPDATVSFTESLDARVPPLGHVRTLSTGVFVQEFPERDAFQLTVRAEGYAPSRWEFLDGETPTGLPLELENLELEIAPESVLWIHTSIDGLDEDDRLIVEYQLRKPRIAAELGTPVVDKGNVAILGNETRIGRLVAGKYLLNFRTSRQRLGSREVEIGVAEEQIVEFHLGPPLPVDGVVLHNGQPVSGGRLSIWGRTNHSNTTAVIDEYGRYSVNLPTPGAYSFAFSPDRDAVADGNGGSQEMEIQEGGRVDLDYRSSRLVGRVIGPRGEVLGQLSGTLFGPQALSFTTDEQGTFEFFDVPHGPYRWLFPHAPEGTFGPMREFVVDGDADVEFRFERSTELELVVRRDTAPEEGTEVGRPQVGLLEAGGQFSPLRPGTRPNTYQWPVEGGLGVVVQRGWAPWFFELGPSDHPSPQTAVLTPGGDLTVTIVSGDGRRTGGTEFTIVPLAGAPLPEEWCRRRTGAQGSMTITLPPGTYRIEAEVAGEAVSTEIEVHARAATEARLP